MAISLRQERRMNLSPHPADRPYRTSVRLPSIHGTTELGRRGRTERQESPARRRPVSKPPAGFKILADVGLGSALATRALDNTGYKLAASALGLNSVATAAAVAAPLSEMLRGFERLSATGLSTATTPATVPDGAPFTDEAPRAADEISCNHSDLAAVVTELSENVLALRQQLAEATQQNGRGQPRAVVAGAMLIGLILLLQASFALDRSAPAVLEAVNDVVEPTTNVATFLAWVYIGVMALGLNQRR